MPGVPLRSVMNSRRFIANRALELSPSLSDLSVKVQAAGCPVFHIRPFRESMQLRYRSGN
jgi:hypothetical protein